MKGTNLGEFQEVVDAYRGVISTMMLDGVSIKDEIKAQTGRTVTLSTVHAALNRLEDKGFCEISIRRCYRRAGRSPQAAVSGHGVS